MDIAFKEKNIDLYKSRFDSIKNLYEDFININNNHKMRIRDISNGLKISEAELLSLNIGNGVQYLCTKKSKNILADILKFKMVMFLTRNEESVHENILNTEYVSIESKLNLEIYYKKELLVIFNKSPWEYVFAEWKNIGTKELKTVQFFNDKGLAVLKIYIKDDNSRYFQKIIDKYSIDYKFQIQKANIGFQEKNNSIDANLFIQTMANKFLNCNNYERYCIQKKGILNKVLNMVSENNYKVGIYVPGPSSIQFYHGEIKRVIDFKGWLNILDAKFNLHVKEQLIEDCICIYYSRLDNKFHLHFYSNDDCVKLGIFSLDSSFTFLNHIKSFIGNLNK